MTDQPIRHFDLTNDIVIDLRHPDVRAAYDAWQTAQVVYDDKYLFEQTSAEETEVDRLKDEFIRIARAHNTVSELT